MAAKKTLLELVQLVLNDIDGDEVNSIDDTVESQQAAVLIGSVYESIMNTKDWPHLRSLAKLNASGTTDRPTHMTAPDNIKRIDFIKYNTKRLTDTKNVYTDIKYKYPDEFINILNHRSSDDASVTSVEDTSGVILHIKNDRPPTFYTSFDDQTLIFDSYDSAVDNTLQSSKTQVMVYRVPLFTLTDNFVPEMPEELFPFLIEECKSRGSVVLRQVVNAKAESESQKQHRWLSMNSWKAKGGVRYPNYGRK